MEPETQKQADEVRDFLTATLPESAPVPIEVDEHVLRAAIGAPVEGEAAAVPEVDRISIPMDPTFNESQPTASKVLSFTIELPHIGNVEPTEPEKTIFLKQFMFDEPIEFLVTLPTGVEVTLRTRTEFQSQVIFEALEQLKEAKAITDPSIGFTMLQQLCATFQVVSVQSRPFPQLKQEEGWSVKETAAAAVKHIRTHFAPMGSAKWTAILTCLRIFQAKISVCENQLANESFWVPAS